MKTWKVILFLFFRSKNTSQLAFLSIIVEVWLQYKSIYIALIIKIPNIDRTWRQKYPILRVLIDAFAESRHVVGIVHIQLHPATDFGSISRDVLSISRAGTRSSCGAFSLYECNAAMRCDAMQHSARLRKRIRAARIYVQTTAVFRRSLVLLVF